MIQKKWTAITAALLLAVLVLAGFLALAAEYGTQDDPLVSLSYINNVLAPETLKKVDAEIEKKIEELNKTIDEKIASSRAEIDGKLLENIDIDSGKIINDAFVTAVAEKVAEKLPGGSTQGGGGFKLVKIAAGKKLTAKVGCEVLLRIGDAVCVASGTPGLIDMTTGGDLKNAAFLEKNHLYLCTIDGRGLKANTDITVLVRGEYTVS
ncbi:MAG: hypothetical protein GX541_05320 [Clostridiales bacterium]|jgi:hypothetical protein|nr:hypothetical protein [Clostridiales bacterium]